MAERALSSGCENILGVAIDRPIGISVIIPIYNAQDTIAQCLDAIYLDTYPGYEVIIAVDGSTDRSLSILEQYCVSYPIRWTIINNGPLGPANGRNVASDIARGDLLFFVDADVLIYPDTIAKIVQFFDAYPEYDAMFGSYDDDPGDGGFLSQYKNISHAYVHQQASVEASTFWTGCGAIRKSVFLEAGGFDARRFSRPSIEDIELGSRLKKTGHRIYLNKDIIVKHLKKWTIRGLIKSDIYDRAIPWTRLILENRDLPNDLNLNQGQRVSAGLAMIILILLGIGIFNKFILLYIALWIIFLGSVNFRSWYGHDVINQPGGPGRSSRNLLVNALSVVILVAISILSTLVPAYFPIFFYPISFLIIFLNRNYYKFFIHKRGVLFTIAVYPMQLLYYWYSILSFIAGIGIHAFILFKKPNKQIVQ